MRHLAFIACVLAAGPALAGISVRLPQGRTAFQTNEWIDFAVARSGPGPAAGPITVEASTPGAATLRFRFDGASGTPFPRPTEHVRLNGRALRPGSYRLVVRCGAESAEAALEVRSHVRRSSFRLIDWGSRATGADVRKLGEDGLGFNTLYAASTGDDSILGGLDFLGCCVMSGGHQMDLRQECDWSDPVVVRGGTRRAARAALRFRAQPNGIGVHFYDEPGLTWAKDPRTGKFTPHAVPSQLAAYTAAFGVPPQDYAGLPGSGADGAARWRHWAEWKLGFMDAAWKHARYATEAAGPNLLSVTQSQYGWSAFTDGYYTNVTRSLPVASGHGGYDDYGPGYFNPLLFLEMGRARDLERPCWYLPTWYGNTTADRYRLEQYLCFMTGLQGMAKPPDMQVHKPGTCPAEAAIVETNKVMGRLGTIFAEMTPTRPSVALLYSLSNVLHAQIANPGVCYVHETAHGQALPVACLAGQVMQRPVLPVVEEEVLDGTLKAHHRAVVLPGLDYLAPETVTALEEFAAGGGTVLMTADCSVEVKGSQRVAVRAEMPDAGEVARLLAVKDYGKMKPYVTVGKYMQAAVKLGTALAQALDKAAIAPECRTANRGIIARRHRADDVEYLFVVNATSAATTADWLAVGPTTAAIGGFAAGASVYDAMKTGPAVGLSAPIRFGAGEMRVFASTRRPITGLRISRPAVRVSPGSANAPISLRFSASAVDASGAPIDGVLPMEIRVLDPAKRVRYHLYRATRDGICTIDLPLATNDAPGTWTVTVRDLLAGKSAFAAFTFAAPVRCAGAAGLIRRARVLDADNECIYRFARAHRSVTIAVGASPWCRPQGERLAAILRPWGIQAAVVDAGSLNRPRSLTEEEAKTWCGIDYAPTGGIRPGTANPPQMVGFDLPGPAILIGCPEDNPLIAELARQQVLAVKSGPGRGALTWERDILAPEVETVSAMGSDAEGVAEAIGTLYERMCGLGMVDELTRPR